MTAEPNSATPESIQAESCFPPPPRVVALPTAATEKWLSRPVLRPGLTARQVLGAVVKEHYDATRERRMFIEGTIDRLEDLRRRLISKLDALDAGGNSSLRFTHIAGDPKSRSEVVTPVFDAAGALIAVLDVDSTRLAAFDEVDACGLEEIVRRVFAG